MFFERRCPICGRSDSQVCPSCASRLRPAPSVRVEGIDAVIALLAYDDASARLILAAKNGGRRDLLRWAAAHLADEVDRTGFDRPAIDLVTWVPAHPRQRRDRGYDQGEVLARHIGRRLGVRCRSTLWRRGGASQKGRGRLDRLDGPTVRARRRSVAGTVLLVDDVTTTGTSLRRSAEALIANGALGICAAVIAASTGPDDPDCHSRTTVVEKRT